MKRTCFLLSSLILSLMFGCGWSSWRKFDYLNTSPTISFSSERSIALAVHDQRPQVLSKKSLPQHVGVLRGGFGNPFKASTASGMPLSDEMLQSISSSLRNKGFSITQVKLTPWEKQEEALEKLKNTGAERIILITLKEWRSNTYQYTALYYDAELKVYDNKKEFLAKSRVSGDQNLGGSVLDPPSSAKKNVPLSTKEKLSKLLNKPDVQNALH